MGCSQIEGLEFLNELLGRNCLVFACDRDLSVVMYKEIPEDAMHSYLVSYVVCKEERGYSLYIISQGKAMLCRDDDIKEIINRYVYPNTESLLLRARNHAGTISSLLGR